MAKVMTSVLAGGLIKFSEKHILTVRVDSGQGEDVLIRS